MELIRLNSLPRNEYHRIRRRQRVGTMKSYLDEDGYVCCDKEELDNYKPKKNGRRPKDI